MSVSLQFGCSVDHLSRVFSCSVTVLKISCLATKSVVDNHCQYNSVVNITEKNFPSICHKMPLFSNKFSPKTIPVRRQDTSVIKKELGSDYASKELSLDVGPLKIKLGDFEVSFEDGQWIPASGKAGAAHRENIRLKSELERLEEENNMLRLKFEILLDMMTDKTVEAEQEMQRAQSLGSIKQKIRKKL